MADRAPDPVPMALAEVLFSHADANQPTWRGSVRPDSVQPQLSIVDKIDAALAKDAKFWRREANLRTREAQAIQAIGQEAVTDPGLPLDMLGFGEARLAARIAINRAGVKDKS